MKLRVSFHFLFFLFHTEVPVGDRWRLLEIFLERERKNHPLCLCSRGYCITIPSHHIQTVIYQTLNKQRPNRHVHFLQILHLCFTYVLLHLFFNNNNLSSLQPIGYRTRGSFTLYRWDSIRSPTFNHKRLCQLIQLTFIIFTHSMLLAVFQDLCVSVFFFFFNFRTFDRA